ncbi:MAG: hypothetical protein K0R69_1039 [Clostridia bacterium]|jgi:hypothetical protein|nr:hypothetical protein [Clostridia bacterium]
MSGIRDSENMGNFVSYKKYIQKQAVLRVEKTFSTACSLIISVVAV